MNTDTVSLGLSGVVLPYPKYKFPPELQSTSRLTIYTTFFNSIEVNASFYKIPQRKTIERWAATVPENFRFTFKLHQEFTHCKFLDYDAEPLAGFIDVISAVGEKKGCILVQFPPSLKSDCILQLENLLHDLKNSMQNATWRLAVEFRDTSWYNDETFDLLKSQNAALVLHDIPKSAAPFIPTSDDFVYVRFHGPTGTYRGSYSDSLLEEYVQYINEWTGEKKKVYVYFNNTAGSAFENAVSLNQLMKASEK